MKNNLRLSILAIAFVSAALSYGQNNKSSTDYLNLPGPIVFQKKSYNLVWTSHPANNFYKHEYMAKGETVAKFKSMILLDLITGNADIKDIVAAKVGELKKLKETNPVVNYESFDNPKIGEYMIDFLLSENTPDGRAVSIAERNVYRYKSITDKSGQKGILLFGVSTRSYGDEVNKFLVALKATRNDLINEVAKFSIPQITIAK